MKRARSQSYTKTSNKTYENTTTPLTGQHDFKTDYAKRRVTPRRRKIYARRRKARRRIVNTVRNANYGTTHLLRRGAQVLNSNVDESQFVCFGLNGLDGDGRDDFNCTNDISEFIREKDTAAWDNFDNNSFTSLPMYNLYTYHATMEITLRNVGEYDLTLEAYFIRGRRTWTGKGLSPTGIYAGGFDRQLLATDPDTEAAFDTKLTATQIGVTPFQNQLFCQHYRIYKRQKFNVPPGNEVNLIIHDPKSHTFTTKGTKGVSTDWRYHGIFFQWQGIPALLPLVTEPPTETFVMAPPTKLAFCCVRRYRAKFLPRTQVQSSFEFTDLRP